MPNTPKLVEERLDDAIDRLEPYFKELYKSGSFAVFNLKVAIKKEMTQELATLKAQVRKEIEELKKSAAISEIHWDDDQKTQRIIDRQKMYAHNQAITDCLSIPSLKDEE